MRRIRIRRCRLRGFDFKILAALAHRTKRHALGKLIAFGANKPKCQPARVVVGFPANSGGPDVLDQSNMSDPKKPWILATKCSLFTMCVNPRKTESEELISKTECQIAVQSVAKETLQGEQEILSERPWLARSGPTRRR